MARERRIRVMTRLVLALSLLILLPATAHAGGFTTVGLDQPPSGIQAGDKWDATFTIRQHGRTPLNDERAVLTITNGRTTKQFSATPTRKDGVYRANVVFPSDGRWQVTIDHGWGVVHRFAAIDVGDAATAATGGGSSDPDWLPAIGAALLAAALAVSASAALSRRRTASAP